MFKLPSLLVPGSDPRYDAIVRKALMEDRESRYQGIREMRTELDSILTQPVMKVEPAASAADVKAAALRTGALLQRPGARLPARPGTTRAQTISHERQRGSLAWLWVTMAVLLVLGGVGWFMFGTPKQEVVVTPQPSASSTASASVTTEKTDATAPQEPPPQIRCPPGWIYLFNGKDLSDWDCILRISPPMCRTGPSASVEAARFPFRETCITGALAPPCHSGRTFGSDPYC